MKKAILIILTISTLTCFEACKKKDQNPTDPKAKEFTFTSLISDHYELVQGNVTSVNANVSGDVSYSWSCSSGDIFGSGKSILFGAGSCCKGDHIVTCTVKDKNENSESKSVTIKVN